MGNPIVTDTWRYSYDGKTINEVLFISDISFVGKLTVCTICGETIREPPSGVQESL